MNELNNNEQKDGRKLNKKHAPNECCCYDSKTNKNVRDDVHLVSHVAFNSSTLILLIDDKLNWVVEQWKKCTQQEQRQKDI